eukprot:21284-Heterococcus_DN1.PRE.2
MRHAHLRTYYPRVDVYVVVALCFKCMHTIARAVALQARTDVAWHAYNANIQTLSKQQIVQQQMAFAIYNGLYTRSLDMRCV